jgi:hypothetical protein
MANRVELVGDDKHRLVTAECFDGRLDSSLVFGIKRGGGFVEEDDWRVLKQCTGNGNALAFTTREQ